MYEELLKQLPTMDAQALQQWQALHKRHVLGEPMTDEEQAIYQAGCDELDATEKLDGDLPYRLLLQEELAHEKADLQRKDTLIAEMQAEIAALEKQIQESTRQRQVSGN